MEIVEKRLTKAVLKHEQFLTDSLGLDVHGADGWNLSCAGIWFRGELGRFGIIEPLANEIEGLFVRYAGSVLSNAPKLREKFAGMSETEVSKHENRS